MEAIILLIIIVVVGISSTASNAAAEKRDYDKTVEDLNFNRSR